MEKLVINLPHRQDRRDLFAANNATSLDKWEYLTAIDGYQITYQDILDMGYDISSQSRCRLTKNRMKSGEVGCAISHLKAWERVVEENKPMMIIEDDVVINKEKWNESYYEELIARDDCEFLYLQINDFYAAEWLGANTNLEYKKRIDAEGDIYKPLWGYNMTAYVLTPKGAKILVDKFKKNIKIVDEFLPEIINRDHFPAYALKEDSCNQISREENQSSIEVGSFEEDRFHDYMNVHFCTVGTSEERLQKLRNSADKNAIKLKNVGEGKDWNDTMSGFGGGPKIAFMLDFLNSEEVHHNDIVLFTDGYDTIFVDDGQTIIDRYLEMNAEVIWAGEQHIWPDKSLQERFHGIENAHISKYKYLNSGGYIGRAGYIKNLFNQYKDAKTECNSHDANGWVDDQEFCQRMFLNQNLSLMYQKIDYECYIFQTHEPNIDKLDNGQMWNPITNSCPCIYHGNGDGLDILLKVYQDHIGDIDEDHENILSKRKPHKPESYFTISNFGNFDVLENDMIICDFMTEEQCKRLITVAEMHGGFQSLEDDKFPAQEIRLKELGIWDELCQYWKEEIYPIVEKYWHPLEMYGMRDAFVMKYSMDTQRSLNLHNDASMVTGSVKLNDNYKGADLWYPRQQISNKDIPVGKMILFPGQVTHGHECTPLEDGIKYSLTMWSSRYPGDIL